MRIWSILLIKTDLKWCIHLSRSLFLYSFYNKSHNFNIITSRCWVAIFHLRPRMGFLSFKWYDIQRLILKIKQLSNKLLMQGHVMECLKAFLEEGLWSIAGSRLTTWSPISRMLRDILDHDHKQSYIPSIIYMNVKNYT